MEISLNGAETTFAKIGNLYCKCQWPRDDGEMILTLVHSDSAWTSTLNKNTLDFGPRAAEYEKVTWQHSNLIWSVRSGVMCDLVLGFD